MTKVKYKIIRIPLGDNFKQKRFNLDGKYNHYYKHCYEDFFAIETFDYKVVFISFKQKTFKEFFICLYNFSKSTYNTPFWNLPQDKMEEFINRYNVILKLEAL
jgi:hypothetical protein